MPLLGGCSINFLGRLRRAALVDHPLHLLRGLDFPLPSQRVGPLARRPVLLLGHSRSGSRVSLVQLS
eukprot:scaffold8329_cov277-Pinguiococcus_pyrenoidosus.AAC.4